MKKIERFILTFGIIGLSLALQNNPIPIDKASNGSNDHHSHHQRLLKAIQDSSGQTPPERKLFWPMYNPYLMSSAYSHLMMNPLTYSLGSYMNPMYSMMMMNPMYSMMMMNPMYSMFMNPMYGMGMYNPMLWGMGGWNNNFGGQNRPRELNALKFGKDNLEEQLPLEQKEFRKLEVQEWEDGDGKLGREQEKGKGSDFKS